MESKAYVALGTVLHHEMSDTIQQLQDELHMQREKEARARAHKCTKRR